MSGAPFPLKPAAGAVAVAVSGAFGAASGGPKHAPREPIDRQRIAHLERIANHLLESELAQRAVIFAIACAPDAPAERLRTVASTYIAAIRANGIGANHHKQLATDAMAAAVERVLGEFLSFREGVATTAPNAAQRFEAQIMAIGAHVLDRIAKGRPLPADPEAWRALLAEILNGAHAQGGA